MWTASSEDRTRTVAVYNTHGCTVKCHLLLQNKNLQQQAVVTKFLTQNLQEFTGYAWITQVITPAVDNTENLVQCEQS